jgi:hypothetical protein
MQTFPADMDGAVSVEVVYWVIMCLTSVCLEQFSAFHP